MRHLRWAYRPSVRACSLFADPDPSHDDPTPSVGHTLPPGVTLLLTVDRGTAIAFVIMAATCAGVPARCSVLAGAVRTGDHAIPPSSRAGAGFCGQRSRKY
jgi:hypothetical protein